MSDDNPTKNRDALKQIVEEIDKDASEVECAGHDMVRSARDTRDLVGIYREFADKIPNDDVLSDEHWKRTTDALAAVRDRGKSVLQLQAPMGNFSIAVAAATSTTNSFYYAVGPVSPSLQPFLEYGKTQLDRIIGRHELMEEVRRSMIRLGLNRIAVKRSALELLEDAKSAADQPQTTTADQPVSVLIPLRESIESSIGELLRRRRKQEETPKRFDKIISIGNQCGRDGLSAGHFDRRAGDAFDLLDRISGTKDHATR